MRTIRVGQVWHQKSTGNSVQVTHMEYHDNLLVDVQFKKLSGDHTGSNFLCTPAEFEDRFDLDPQLITKGVPIESKLL